MRVDGAIFSIESGEPRARFERHENHFVNNFVNVLILIGPHYKNIICKIEGETI